MISAVMCFPFMPAIVLFQKKKLPFFLSFSKVYITFSDQKSLPRDAHERKTPPQTTNLLKALPQIQTKLKANPQNLHYFSAKFPLHPPSASKAAAS